MYGAQSQIPNRTGLPHKYKSGALSETYCSVSAIIVACRLPTSSPITILGERNSSGYIAPATIVKQMRGETVVEFGCDCCKWVDQALCVDLYFITQADDLRALRESFCSSGGREEGSSCQLVPYTFRLLAQSNLLASKSQINPTQITEIPEILPVVTHFLHPRKKFIFTH